MTTDTFPKAATRTAAIGGAEVRITGIAKGSGMIAPDMATMLCFVFTDAAVAAAGPAADAGRRRRPQLQLHHRRLRHLHLATPCCCSPPARPATRRGRAALADFRRALDEVLLDLAMLVVRDGEGAQKLVRIDVDGAVSDASAQPHRPRRRQLAPGQNRHRRRGRQLGPHRHGGRQGRRTGRPRPLGVAVGGTWMARTAAVVPGYDETPVVAHMKGREIDIAVDIGLGQGRATVWTCDLTHGYIDINGSYRS